MEASEQNVQNIEYEKRVSSKDSEVQDKSVDDEDITKSAENENFVQLLRDDEPQLKENNNDKDNSTEMVEPKNVLEQQNTVPVSDVKTESELNVTNNFVQLEREYPPLEGKEEGKHEDAVQLPTEDQPQTKQERKGEDRNERLAESETVEENQSPVPDSATNAKSELHGTSNSVQIQLEQKEQSHLKEKKIDGEKQTNTIEEKSAATIVSGSDANADPGFNGASILQPGEDVSQIQDNFVQLEREDPYTLSEAREKDEKTEINESQDVGEKQISDSDSNMVAEPGLNENKNEENFVQLEQEIPHGQSAKGNQEHLNNVSKNILKAKSSEHKKPKKRTESHFEMGNLTPRPNNCETKDVDEYEREVGGRYGSRQRRYTTGLEIRSRKFIDSLLNKELCIRRRVKGECNRVIYIVGDRSDSSVGVQTWKGCLMALRQAALHTDAFIVDTAGKSSLFVTKGMNPKVMEGVNSVGVMCSNFTMIESKNSGSNSLHRVAVVVSDCVEKQAASFAASKVELTSQLSGGYKIVALMVGNTDAHGHLEQELRCIKEKGWPLLMLQHVQEEKIRHLIGENVCKFNGSVKNAAELASFLHIHLTVNVFAL